MKQEIKPNILIPLAVIGIVVLGILVWRTTLSVPAESELPIDRIGPNGNLATPPPEYAPVDKALHGRTPPPGAGPFMPPRARH